jgi:hypothetical protein
MMVCAVVMPPVMMPRGTRGAGEKRNSKKRQNEREQL